MYTSRTGIVYIYRNDTFVLYYLMYSTHTTRPKIKTGNPSPHTHHQQQKFTTSHHLTNCVKSTYNSPK
nr:MAG TPA: hypothetical protein [Caudoviricetes sp.]